MNNTLRKILTENITIKIISVALAVFLWFFVTFKGQTETSLEIPLEFKNTPSEMEILKQSVKKITVSISARERIFREISRAEIRVIVDLSNVKYGENSIPITRSSIKLPRGIEILRIEPSVVKVFMDKKERKTVPVRAVVTGNPAQGFILSSVEVNPSSITIEGAKSELDRIRVLKTEPVDIEGINENLTTQVKINPDGRIFRSEKDTIYVTVKLRRK
ncbi:CdaR family protein [Thermodesulfovibrio hydrogeniphilus]